MKSQYAILQGQAAQAVNRAIVVGYLRPAKTVKCVDCSRRAHDYDHRDYTKPLEVQPVCRRHNKLRGHAEPRHLLETHKVYLALDNVRRAVNDCLFETIGQNEPAGLYEVGRAIWYCTADKRYMFFAESDWRCAVFQARFGYPP